MSNKQELITLALCSIGAFIAIVVIEVVIAVVIEVVIHTVIAR